MRKYVPPAAKVKSAENTGANAEDGAGPVTIEIETEYYDVLLTKHLH